MHLLEYYHHKVPKNNYYIPRKCQFPSKGDINFYGVRGSGKTTILLDLFLTQDEKDYLYIDLEDPNLIFHPLTPLILQQYIDKEHITLLVLDHYDEGMFSYFPNVDRLIIVSRKPLSDNSLMPLELFPLDYEEFLAFENTLTQNKGFNHFLRAGTLPLIAHSQKNITHAMKTFLQSNFTSTEQKLLLVLAKHHTQHITIHQIYTFSKENFKVSKDWIYKTIKAFSEEKLIHFIEDHHKKSGKKMLLFDFAFAKYLTFGQPFIVQFDAMVALTLIKHHIIVKTLGVHGYLTKNNELIIPAPFESEESLWVKSQNKFSLYKQYHIKKVTIITITNSYEYSIEKIIFEALPFNEWSVISGEMLIS